MSLLVVIETRRGEVNPLSLEALAAGRKIAEARQLPVHIAILGAETGGLSERTASFGIQKVWAVEHPLLQRYTPEGYTAAIEQLLRAQQPKFVVFPHTYQVRDFAPKLATRFGTVLISDCIGISGSGTEPDFARQLFQGKLNQELHSDSAIQFISFQAGAFRPAVASESSAAIEKFTPQLDESMIHTKPEEPFRDNEQAVDLRSANIIVSVGRGIKEKENLGMVEELAGALGAELAASRPICDNGWLPIERQVGSSGQTVAPKIYFAVGISGAIQHIVGMRGSGTIVAINKDEDAPIFESADYGIVGDLFEVVPALIEELKKAKS